jgi:hypothetical protein
MANISLLGNTSRIETPFVKITIGNYTFGVFQKIKGMEKDETGFYEAVKIIYPNYIKSLQITKINGEVNTYTLNISYPITPEDDPNFFEKVFSSVSNTRKIVFSYGDMSLPTFIYKNEEAIITDIKSNFNIQSSVISYIISAVSSAVLLKSGCYSFINNMIPKKPSDEIKKLLYNKDYGLQDIFYGMNNADLVNSKGLIAGDDKKVIIESKTNISALDYLTYLVSCMVPASSDATSIKQKDIYIMTIIDDTTGEFGGPYFKITKTTKDISQSTAYEIDIGYPTANIVTAFNIDNNENYSIFYNWQKQLNDKDYVYRINSDGTETLEYAPIISSRNDNYKTRVSDQTWWTKITEYPISVSITFKGLIRPAILMTYVRLKVYFFGWKHISSGLYIVTKQQDVIDESGYRTTLNLTRIASDDGKETDI